MTPYKQSKDGVARRTIHVPVRLTRREYGLAQALTKDFNDGLDKLLRITLREDLAILIRDQIGEDRCSWGTEDSRVDEVRAQIERGV